MNSWKVILATMVIFGAGVVTGGILVRQTMFRPGQALHKQGSTTRLSSQTFTPGSMRVDFLRRAQRELELTPEQRDQIDEILRRSQDRTRKAMEAVAPKLREEVQKTREEFREVLTARQRNEFDRLWKQQQQQQRPRDPRTAPRERPAGPGQPPQEPVPPPSGPDLN